MENYYFQIKPKLFENFHWIENILHISQYFELISCIFDEDTVF